MLRAGCGSFSFRLRSWLDPDSCSIPAFSSRHPLGFWSAHAVFLVRDFTAFQLLLERVALFIVTVTLGGFFLSFAPFAGVNFVRRMPRNSLDFFSVTVLAIACCEALGELRQSLLTLRAGFPGVSASSFSLGGPLLDLQNASPLVLSG